MASSSTTVQGSLWTLDKSAKLAGESNFVSWKSMIQPILKACGCWPYITGRRVRPPYPLLEGVRREPDETLEPTAEQDLWDQKDQHAFAILINSLTTKVAVQFSSSTTSQHLWEAIHSRYEWASDQRLIHLQMQFEMLTIHDGDSIKEKLTKFISLKDKIAAIGTSFSDRERSLKLLSKLPPTWESLSTQLL